MLDIYFHAALANSRIVHLGLARNRRIPENENGSYSLDGIPPETTIVSPVI